MLTTYLFPFAIAFFLAINMGASGTAPSFAAPYGAGLIRRELIPGLFGSFVLLGAVLAGQKVVKTLGGEILPSTEMQMVLVSLLLLAVSLSLFFANLLRVPQSTSQSTVFALMGSALYLGKLQTTKLLFVIIPTWFVLPLVAFVVTYLFARFVYSPLKQLPQFDRSGLSESSLWRYLTVSTSCYVAFSIGSNNVANAVGPLNALLVNHFQFAEGSPDFALLLVLTTIVVAPGFGIGSSLMGERVMRTTAREIAEFGHLGASFVSFVTATLLLLASITRGIPTSLVQLNTAAIFAIGVWRVGLKKTVADTSMPKLLTIWAVAPLFAFLCAYALTALADAHGWLW